MNSPCIPLDQDIDFAIMVEWGTKPFSIPSYKMGSTK